VIQPYAIADHPGPPVPDAAVGVRSVPAGRLEALCAEVGETEVSPEALWRHEEVVEALMESRDLLPVRYGTRLPDEAGVVSAVAERHDALLAALNRVRGAVELSLRLAAPPEAEIPREAAERLHAQLAPLARDATLLDSGDSRDLLRAAYLVDRGAMAPFTDAVARLQRAHPELRLLCTGPWPPYSFASP
jgi:gas vesicle protein GvpL/GvpF